MKHFAAIALAATLALSGCSTQVLTPTPTPTSSPAKTFEALTPAQAKAEFAKLAEASCDKAMAEGVVEGSDKILVVAVPKDQAYKDYSAAYTENGEKFGLIWELDALLSCADSFSFTMAAEAGQEADIAVTFNDEDGTFTTFEDFGEFGTSNYKFSVDNGVFTSAENLDEPFGITTIKYGAPNEQELNVLHTAVDEFLAKG